MGTLIQTDMALVTYRLIICRNVTEMTLAEHLVCLEFSPTQTTAKRSLLCTFCTEMTSGCTAVTNEKLPGFLSKYLIIFSPDIFLSLLYECKIF